MRAPPGRAPSEKPPVKKKVTYKNTEIKFKAPPVENFAWLLVGSNSDKTACGSVSLI